MSKLRLVFMGTPEFAVGILKAIQKSEHELVAVVTTADKPAGRGREIQESAVKKYASTIDVPVFQPTNLKEESFIESLREFNADLFFVVAFRFLPQSIWSIPLKGTVNLHASLLPDYRGAAPIHRAIMNGETRSGLTTFLIDKSIDTGAMLLKTELSIGEDETVGSLHDRMITAGAKLSVETLHAIANNEVEPQPQGEESEKKAPKIFPEDCLIDWSWSLSKIHNHVRGLSPYPRAQTYFERNGKKEMVKIIRGVKEMGEVSSSTPKLDFDKKGPFIVLPEGIFRLLELQPQGKKAISGAAFVNGIQNNTEWKLWES